MSFQDSVIKEIADMTTTKEPLYKITYIHPIIDDEGIELDKKIIILDYSTFVYNCREDISDTDTDTLKHNWEKILAGGRVDAYWFGNLCADYEYKYNDLTKPNIDYYVANVELLN